MGLAAEAEFSDQLLAGSNSVNIKPTCCSAGLALSGKVKEPLKTCRQSCHPILEHLEFLARDELTSHSGGTTESLQVLPPTVAEERYGHTRSARALAGPAEWASEEGGGRKGVEPGIR